MLVCLVTEENALLRSRAERATAAQRHMVTHGRVPTCLCMDGRATTYLLLQCCDDLAVLLQFLLPV